MLKHLNLAVALCVVVHSSSLNITQYDNVPYQDMNKIAEEWHAIPIQPEDPDIEILGLPPTFCVTSRYRTMNGSCNNLLKPNWGVPNNPYGRLTPYNYGDGIESFPRASSGKQLPNAREISLLLFPEKRIDDAQWNLNAQQWGQFLSHDMSLTAGVAQINKGGKRKDKFNMTCCDPNGQLSVNASDNPYCAPIMVPPNDPINAPEGKQCLNFIRTLKTMDEDGCPPNTTAESLSAVTAFMDLSMVYGSSEAEADRLRTGSGGRLITLTRGGREWPPQEPNVSLTCETANSTEPCYLTGDVRANQSPPLSMLHVFLLREHNRIAKILAQLNPHWCDEKVYQETRRINIAVFQHISFYEYLPIFLGLKNMIKRRLIYPNAPGYVNDYNPDMNPAVLDEHATAAFRHFHTLVRGSLPLISAKHELLKTVRLSDWFNRPLLLEMENGLDNMARGLTMHPQDSSDQYWDHEITQCLFKRHKTYGSDLRALDIQRGRDHGLGTYITMRTACGLPVPKTFDDMKDFISPENVKVLQSIYESPQDVELVVAGSLEKLVPGALAGPTYLCILTEQFYRTRTGDRYFYENGFDSESAFTLSQLNTIRRASIARLVCDNGDNLLSMQPKAFQQIGEGNQLVLCSQLPKIDLTLWKEDQTTNKCDQNITSP